VQKSNGRLPMSKLTPTLVPAATPSGWRLVLVRES
jgi:hypothetical protein